MYGSNFCAATLIPLAFKSLPNEAAVIPLPKPDTTPPVTNIYFVIMLILLYSHSTVAGGFEVIS